MLIKVKVFPSSKVESIVKKKEDSFEVCVRELPIEGMASQRVIQVLVDYFRIERSKIRLIKGAKKRNKIFEILN
ncbi:MAG: DUF167 domain-containing protein [Candidatus Paceibacterota bacterium]|jgi:uncharacterized protein YggU (UPF0235/DUF167 family)|nr:DUF167 family protein [bacterium]